MQPEGSLPYSRKPAIGLRLEPDEFSPQPYIFFSLRPILLLSFHPCLWIPSVIFLSGFPTKNFLAFLVSPVCVTCPAHLILLDLITLTISCEEYKLWYPLIWLRQLNYELRMRDRTQVQFFCFVTLCGGLCCLHFQDECTNRATSIFINSNHTYALKMATAAWGTDQEGWVFCSPHLICVLDNAHNSTTMGDTLLGPRNIPQPSQI